MIINLISSPRNISTALMYSFAQRPDTKVIDEPFYGYYLKLTAADHPGKDDIVASMPTDITSIIEEIAEIASKHEIVFIKNMAHHLIAMDLSFLQSYTNLFLIRDPKLLITSFAKVIPNPSMQDIGCAHQFSIFNQLLNQKLVMDSGEVVKNPSFILKKYCELIGIPFYDQMLSWEPGAIKEDGIWAKYWYANVHRSRGFDPPKTSTEPLPRALTNLYTQALPYYESMYQYAIKAP